MADSTYTPDPALQGETGSGTKRLPAVSTDPAYVSEPADVELLVGVEDRHHTTRWDGVIPVCRCGSREDNHEIIEFLRALAAAGRLQPTSVEIRTEWGVLWDSPGGQRSRQSVYDEDEARVAVAAAEPGWTPYLVSRMSWVGPWLPAPTEESA